MLLSNQVNQEQRKNKTLSFISQLSDNKALTFMDFFWRRIRLTISLKLVYAVAVRKFRCRAASNLISFILPKLSNAIWFSYSIPNLVKCWVAKNNKQRCRLWAACCGCSKWSFKNQEDRNVRRTGGFEYFTDMVLYFLVEKCLLNFEPL